MDDSNLDDLYNQLMSERYGELWKPLDVVESKE